MWCIKCGRQGKNESCDYCGGLMVDYNPKDNVVLYDKKVIKIPSKNGGYCYRCGKYSGSSHKICAYCGGDLFTIQHTTVPKKYIIIEKKFARTMLGLE